MPRLTYPKAAFRYRRMLFVFAVMLTFSVDARAQRNAYERAPIDYFGAPVNDAVAKLSKRIESGETKLSYDERRGYLQSLLAELDVPESSQTLVFSKTSLQLSRISPRRPRALYFNDDVYVGYCQNGDVLELAVTDPRQGAIFYTLKQTDADKPTIVRDRGQCLSCHSSSRTQNVPGYVMRSVFADAGGQPKFGSGTYNTDHTTEFEYRWGGWYVTGQHGDMRHMGNSICTEDGDTFDRDPGANEQELSDRFRTAAYLTPDSDIVALMVLGHQTQMHNAIAAANYETRQALYQTREMNKLLDRPEDHISDSARRRIESSADRVLRHLLMCDEFALTDGVKGSTEFSDVFQAKGKPDERGRSLRDLDLETRLFRYPCSYLIHSAAFKNLPDEVRTRVLEKLAEILDGKDESPDYKHLTKSMRRAIKEILRDTHPEFKQHV